ncbi:condensation domain-containing protein [Micromonospora sp. NPDC001898]|uniref:condensation domain-containing protein n=1 Tax=Micromonospora sp. NPDC001898 TaxID=3364221 RepID=UPI003690FC47
MTPDVDTLARLWPQVGQVAVKDGCVYVVAEDYLDPLVLRGQLAAELTDAELPRHVVQVDSLDPADLVAPDDRYGVYLPPRDDTERVLVRVWERVLGVPKLGVLDDFYAAGGDSLAAAGLAVEAQRVFGVAVSLAAVLRHPTVAALADEIRRSRAAAPLPPAAAGVAHPLSPQQRRVYLAQSRDPASVAYHLPLVLPLPADVDAGRLAGAFRHVIARHDVLRTAFGTESGRPVQRVLAGVTFELPEVPAPADAPVPVSPFDLAAPPLLRAELRRTPAGPELALELHHIVTDGLSLALLLREVDARYAGRDLPPVPAQYADYAAWVDGREPPGRDWWLGRFADPPAPPRLPTDADRPAGDGPAPTAGSGVVEFTVDADRTAALRALARREGVTLFQLLLAVYATFLATTTGGAGSDGVTTDGADVTVGTPVAGRGAPGLDAAMGMFVNTVCLRHRVRPDAPFRALLDEVARDVVDAFAHQDFPFDSLVEAVLPVRDPHRHPLFDTLFAMQHDEVARVDFLGRPVELAIAPTGQAMFDLDMQVYERADSLRVHWAYHAGLFLPETVRAFADLYLELLDAVLADPGRPVGVLTGARPAADPAATIDIDIDL